MNNNSNNNNDSGSSKSENIRRELYLKGNAKKKINTHEELTVLNDFLWNDNTKEWNEEDKNINVKNMIRNDNDTGGRKEKGKEKKDRKRKKREVRKNF